MTYKKFEEVADACEVFARATETGCRNIEEKANQLLAEYVRKNGKRRGSSTHFVYVHSKNLGTKKYPHVIKVVEIERMSDFKESDKTFHNGYSYVSKKSVIGFVT